ncbi:MAG: hypothetical protein Kow00127_06970 [Bacteroidales bacterium]
MSLSAGIRVKTIVATLFTLILPFWGAGQMFIPAGTPFDTLPGIRSGVVLPGDVNKDGLTDLFLSGTSDEGITTRLFLWTNSGWSEPANDFPQMTEDDACWCDPDGDGDLDLFFGGEDSTGTAQLVLLRNECEGTFSQWQTWPEALFRPALAAADLDGDGDHELLAVGRKNGTGATWIFENMQEEGFQLIPVAIDGFFQADIALADYNKDLKPDILISGMMMVNGIPQRNMKLYRNNGGFQFEESGAWLVGLSPCNLEWCDYDMDGDPDILANGQTDAPTYLVYIYKNLGNDLFLNNGIEIFGTIEGAAQWCDYDADGDPDFMLTGLSSVDSLPLTELYLNIGADLFTTVSNAGLPVVGRSDLFRSDWNQDHRADLVLCGEDATGALVTTLLLNNSEAENTPPEIGGMPEAEIVPEGVLLSWPPAGDLQTAQNGLTYNLELKMVSGATIVPAMALEEGKRLLPEPGNAGNATSMYVTGLPAGSYSARIQALDAQYEASPFSEILTFNYEPLDASAQASSRMNPGPYWNAERRAICFPPGNLPLKGDLLEARTLQGEIIVSERVGGDLVNHFPFLSSESIGQPVLFLWYRNETIYYSSLVITTR